MKVAVLGLGMIGGSVARGLAARGVEVVGFDMNHLHLDAASADGVISDRVSDDLSHLCGADTVVIAVHGDTAIDMLRRLEPFAAELSLVTDVGSTKKAIVAAAEQSPLAGKFVGAHPFAGDHRSGWAASRFDLFDNETVYLCPSALADITTVTAAHDLWSLLGAKSVKIDAAEHDGLMAWTSHLPHMLSTAFALALSGAGVAHRQLGRGGRDVARLAAGSPDVWTAISLDNADAMCLALDAVEQQIGEFRTLLSGNDRHALHDRFSRAQRWSGPAER
jgi:prephenate dehydrogenase